MEIDLHDVIISTWRWMAGLVIGSMVALLVTLVVRRMGRLRDPAVLAISFFRSLPILALVPLFAQVLGIEEASKISLIAWACFFPVLISTLRSESEGLLDLELKISATNLSPRSRFRHYDLPRILFGFVAGVEISIGIGWLTVVAAEMIATYESGLFRGGLGKRVFDLFQNGNLEAGLYHLMVFGILGLGTSYLWRRLSIRLISRMGFEPEEQAA